MELDLPMMEIGYAFQKTLEKAKKSLAGDAKSLGAGWVRHRITSSPVLRWNPVRKKALERTVAVADYAVNNSAGPKITAPELSAAIRQLGKPDGQGKIRLDDCPF